MEIELTIEQQFEMATFQARVAQMSKAETETALLYLYRTYLVQNSIYKKLLAREWGIDTLPAIGNSDAS